MTIEFENGRTGGGAGPVQGIGAEMRRSRTVALSASRREDAAREEGREEKSLSFRLCAVSPELRRQKKSYRFR